MIAVDPKTTTVRDVVVDDYRTAAVFQKYGLDFCCGGGATIERACEKKGIDPADLVRDLSSMTTTASAGEPRMSTWDPAFLADYIVQNHHAYVRNVTPSILEHAEKVARVHGPARSSLVDVATAFAKVSAELEAHMYKEERVLFPYIKELARAAREGNSPAPSPFGTISRPIRAMEEEHRSAGDEMAEIRRLTEDYTPPPDACMTYRVLFQELEDFERDLHRHVHLENNLLFPKALALEEESATHGVDA